jgi:hypothetical protein
MLQKHDPCAIDKCAMVFVPPLANEKRRNPGVLLTSLHNLQTRIAFIAAFTSLEQQMTIEKGLFRIWPMIMIFS